LIRKVTGQIADPKEVDFMKTRIGLLLTLATLVAVVSAPVIADEGEHAYVGTKSCKKCHIKEWKSWSETKMATAYEVLSPGAAAEVKQEIGLDPEKDYTTDEACVKCHVTGFGKPGGFTDIETTPELAGVGCEVCHGPGGSYTQDGFMTLQNREFKRDDLLPLGYIYPVGENVCIECHNEEVPFPDYTFDFESMKAKGLHEAFPLKYEH